MRRKGMLMAAVGVATCICFCWAITATIAGPPDNLTRQDSAADKAVAGPNLQAVAPEARAFTSGVKVTKLFTPNTPRGPRDPSDPLVWDNGEIEAGNLPSNQIEPGGMFLTMSADDFMLDIDTYITGVSWCECYWDPGGSTWTNMHVYIWPDDGTGNFPVVTDPDDPRPDAIAHYDLDIADCNGVENGWGTGSGGRGWDFWADLPAITGYPDGFEASAGVKYWIAITPELAFPPQCGAFSQTSNLQLATRVRGFDYFDLDFWTREEDEEIVFKLYGTPQSTEVAACCHHDDGTCTMLAPIPCLSLPGGGSWMGEGTECSTTVCFGACCYYDGHCEVVTYTACNDHWPADWQGYGSECSPNPCDQPCDITCVEPGTRGEVYEPLPCDESVQTNMGCIGDTPGVDDFREPIACGETVCGTYWVDFDPISEYLYRDIDWYEIVVTKQTIITYTFHGELPSRLGIPQKGEPPDLEPVDTGDCADWDPGWSYIWDVPGTPCTTQVIESDCLHPGTYWLYVAPQFPPDGHEGTINEWPCTNDYTLEVACNHVCAPDPACVIENSPGGSYGAYLNRQAGDEFKVFFDPTDCGDDPTYPFLLRTITVPIYDGTGFGYPAEDSYGTLDITIDIECAASLSGDPCSGPGDMIDSWAFQIVVEEGNTGSHNLVVDLMDVLMYPEGNGLGMCMGGPFFISIHWDGWTGDAGLVPTVIWDDESVSTLEPCHQWTKLVGQTEWEDFEVTFPDPNNGWIDMSIAGDTPENQDWHEDLPCTDEHCSQWPRDIFPSNLYIEIEIYGMVPDPYQTILHLTSYGHPDAQVSRTPPPYTTGTDIQTEMLSLELSNHPTLAPADGVIGPVTVTERSDILSPGAIIDVTDDGAGGFQSGDSHFNIWADFYLETLGWHAYTKVWHPMRSNAYIEQLPPWGAIYDWPWDWLPGTIYYKGDVNQDGLVNGDDIQCFVDCFMGTAATPPCYCWQADMDYDGDVDMDDVQLFILALLYDPYAKVKDGIYLWYDGNIIGKIISIRHIVKDTYFPGACCYNPGSGFVCTEIVVDPPDDESECSDLASGGAYTWTPQTFCEDLDPLCGGGACCHADEPSTCERVYLHEQGPGPSYKCDLDEDQYFQDEPCYDEAIGPNSRCQAACCLREGELTGECAIEPVWRCFSSYGDFVPYDDCDPNICMGACCYPSGECLVQTEDACTLVLPYGLYQGDGTDCSPNECPFACPEGSRFDQPAVVSVATASDAEAGIIRYEDYTLDAGFVCDVHWWGLEIDGSNAACTRTNTFEIKFYPDNAGEPDAANPSCEYDAVIPTRFDTGQIFDTGDAQYPIYYYSVPDLTAYLPTMDCCATNPGWISIQGVGDTECFFYWLSAGTYGSGSHCADEGEGINCGVSQSSDFDLGVCLTQ